MRRLLLFAIAAYRFLIPERLRRRCLFRVSCSRYVEETLRSDGLIAGLRALAGRARRCRPGYRLGADGERLHIVLADGSHAAEAELSPHVLAPYARALALATLRVAREDAPGNGMTAVTSLGREQA